MKNEFLIICILAGHIKAQVELKLDFADDSSSKGSLINKVNIYSYFNLKHTLFPSTKLLRN